MQDLRKGLFDVLIGVNLLREGLDLPEVSLVAILDADKEGFLRSHRSLTQTVGRAARNVNGRAIMYADKITDSMKKTIEETERRRSIQMAFNEKKQITPTAISKKITNVIPGKAYDTEPIQPQKVAEIDLDYLGQNELEKKIRETRKMMETAAKNLDFLEAANHRDAIKRLQEKLKELK